MNKDTNYSKRPNPDIYDVEKIYDIHSSEADPSFDSKKVREVNSNLPRPEDTHEKVNNS